MPLERLKKAVSVTVFILVLPVVVSILAVHFFFIILVNGIMTAKMEMFD